jgi:CheY-like chemotaxis protein
MYQRLFAHENHEVVLAQDGLHAIDLTRKTQPDLILLDILLPGTSGLEVLQNLKIQEDTKDIPVIIISNLAGEDTIADAKRLGAEDYMVKADFSPELVLQAVSKYLTKHTLS